MSGNSLTGKDTIVINNRVLADFGDGDVLNLTFPNNKITAKRGKNGNTIFALNETGLQADVELRILKGSSDDKFLNSLSIAQNRDLPSFSLLTGEFTKRIGDGAGNIASEVYEVSGGAFVKEIDNKENVEGNTDQGIAIYRLIFANAPRSLT
jgi:hypothetical protein